MTLARFPGLLALCLASIAASDEDRIFEATIADIQSLPSPEVVLLQLCDVLLGAASSRLNNTLGQGTAKEAVVRKLEERLNIHGRIGPTRRTEEKYNVFRIRLDGGW